MAQSYPPLLPSIPDELIECLVAAAAEMASQTGKAFRLRRNTRRSGRTLRPGSQTPLWNQLRAQLRLHVRKYGEQVNLGRVLGLPRQQVNAFITRGDRMPDAERTLQLLAWLMAVREGRRPG